MTLALRELVRRPARFVTATGILTLIALLLMFLGGLLDGLIANATGAVRAQDADLVVYSEASQASFLRSRVEPGQRSRIEAVTGVARTGGLGVALLGARVPGNGPRDLADVALWGYESAPRGVPSPPPPGEAYADEILRADGIEVGMTVLVGPARSPITVIGWVSDTAYNGQGGLWTEPATWRRLVSANRPQSVVADGVFQALVVRGDGSLAPAALAAAIETAAPGTLALTVPEAIDAIPGVSEQRTTFNQILGVTAAIGAVVIALFFTLITVERSRLYAVLKAVGAGSGRIFAGLVAQAVIVATAAAVIAGVAVWILDLVIPVGSVPLAISLGRILASALLLTAAAVFGCAFSLRRVLRVDPASALGGGA